MNVEQDVSVRWNDRDKIMLPFFENLLESGILVDCTIEAEGQFLKAHKAVLSACSPYFQLLFNQHNENHPIIILKDVKFQELKAVMDYIYRGEVKILEEQLTNFYVAAQLLQIKGLGCAIVKDIFYTVHSEKYLTLCWHDHNRTLLAFFETLLESATLVDCTIATEGQFLKAHKVVLSACSPYFQLLLSEHNENHPIIILRKLKFQELKVMLDCIYRGEVKIPGEQLHNFNEAVQLLQIKGVGDDIIRNQSNERASCINITSCGFDDHPNQESANSVRSIEESPGVTDCRRTSTVGSEIGSHRQVFCESLPSSTTQDSIGSDNIVSTLAEQNLETGDQDSHADTRSPHVVFPDVEAGMVGDDPFISTEPVEDPLRLKEEDIDDCDLDERKDLNTRDDLHVIDAPLLPVEENIPHFPIRLKDELGLLIDTEGGPDGVASTSSAEGRRSPRPTPAGKESASAGKTYSCPDCQAAFLQKKLLRQHMLSQGHSFKCRLCEYETSRHLQLDAHIRSHTGEKPFKCKHCGYACALGANLYRHMHLKHKGVSDTEPASCPQCAATFRSPWFLAKHMRSQGHAWKCELCGHVATGRAKLSDHMRKHTNERPFKCPHCEYAATARSILGRHLQMHARGGGRGAGRAAAAGQTFFCPECSSAYPDSLRRKMHMIFMRHAWKCAACGFSSSSRVVYGRHVALHSRDKAPTLKCARCDYTSAQREDFDRHLRVHPGEAAGDADKPFECAHCVYRTSRASYLTNHLARVHGFGRKRAKPREEREALGSFCCPECSDTFPSARALMRHVVKKGHLYKCAHCDYVAPSYGAHVEHVRKHTGEKPFQCEHCKFRSARVEGLVGHRRRVHGIGRK